MIGSWNARSLCCDNVGLHKEKIRILAEQVAKHDHFVVQELRGDEIQCADIARRFESTHFALWSAGSSSKAGIISFHRRRSLPSNVYIFAEQLARYNDQKPNDATQTGHVYVGVCQA